MNGMNSEDVFADVRFKVCETENEPYICTLEDVHPKVSMSLLLEKGTSFDEAQNIGLYLNDHIPTGHVTIPRWPEVR
jgi:hypothetical protein